MTQTTPSIINRKFNPALGVDVLDAVDGVGVQEHEIPGLAVKVKTFGGGLDWNRLDVPKDTSIVTEKRDRFEARNDFINKVAEAGCVEYALAYAPKVQGSQLQAANVLQAAGPRQGYACKCAFCGAGHNWVVFYRRADEAGKYLGYSGVDCFAEVVTNLRIPAAEAIIEAARKEEGRCKRFVETIGKINDFKRDFPGLYENRKVLRSSSNPYARLWIEVEQQLNRATGIDEAFLQKCLDGGFDRKASRYRRDQSARRIPAFLQAASALVRENGLQGALDALVEKSYGEEYGSPFRRIRPGAAPQPQDRVTVAANGPQPAPAEVIAKAKRLIDEFGYKWSYIVRDVASGRPVSDRWIEWVENHFEKAVAKFVAGGVQ